MGYNYGGGQEMRQCVDAVGILVWMQFSHFLGACKQRKVEAVLAISLLVVLYSTCYNLLFQKASLYLQTTFVKMTAAVGPVGGLIFIVTLHLMLLFFLIGSVTASMHGMLTKSDCFRLFHYRLRSPHLLGVLALAETVVLVLFVTEVVLWPLSWMPYVSFLAPAAIVRLLIFRFFAYGIMMALATAAVVVKIRLDKREHGAILEWGIGISYYSLLILSAYRIKIELENPVGGILTQIIAVILKNGVDGKHEIAYLSLGLMSWILTCLLVHRSLAKAVST
jgi:hypothetical protein